MAGLRNFEVEKYGKEILGKNFLGVFPCDATPSNFKKKRIASIIFNLSKHNQEGSHFVSVLKVNDKYIYFDPLGNPCSNKYISNFLLNCTNEVLRNTKIVQSTTSMFCGIFCLAFLKFCQNKNKSLSFFLSKFDENLELNNNIALNLVLSK